MQKIIYLLNNLFRLSFSNQILEDRYNKEYISSHKEQNALAAKVTILLFTTYAPFVYLLIDRDFEKLLFVSLIGVGGALFLLHSLKNRLFERHPLGVLFTAAFLVGSAPLIMYNITTADRTFFLVDILLPFFGIATMYGITFAFSLVVTIALLLFFVLFSAIYGLHWDDFVVSTYALASGAIVGLLAAYMTERTNRELFLSQLHGKELEAIVENLEDAVAIIDFDTMRYLYANKTALELNGYSYNELIGIPLYKVHTTLGKKRLEGIRALLEKEGSYYDDVFELKDKQGNSFYLHVVAQLCNYKGYRAVILISSDVTKYKQKQLQIETMAMRDQLTGLYNRYKFKEYAKLFLYQARRNKMDVSLIICDIDLFKEVNDKFGHLVGDKVLKEIAAILQNNVRKSDIVSRWGGEEFAILLPMTGEKSAFEVAKKITKKVSSTTFQEAGKVTISCGVAQLRENEELDSLFLRADKALYTAKEQGRNRVVSAD